MFFPAPGDTPCRDFWLEATGIILMGLVLKQRSTSGKLKKQKEREKKKNRSYLPQNIFADKKLEALG